MIAHYTDTHSFTIYTLSHIFLLQYRCPFVRIVPWVPAVLSCCFVPLCFLVEDL
jgi:hypothetical protein